MENQIKKSIWTGDNTRSRTYTLLYTDVKGKAIHGGTRQEGVFLW